MAEKHVASAEYLTFSQRYGQQTFSEPMRLEHVTQKFKKKP